MLVYLDSAPENLTPELGLEAERILDQDWNGWLRPLATAASFGRFLDAWRSNDPNGDWGYATEVGDSLLQILPGVEEPADEFPKASETSSGEPLYDLSGWVWVSPDTSKG